MSDESTGQAPAAWYPQGDGSQRYWDGSQWTEHIAPGPGATPAHGGAPGTPGAAPQSSSSTAKVLIPVGACVALAVIAVVIAALASGGDDSEETTRATISTEATTEDQAVDTTEGPNGDPTTTTTTEPEETTTTGRPEPDGSQDSPLALGTGTRVGDYEVTLVTVNLDGTEAVRSENQFNEAPSNGAYALVTINATYVGNEEGMPNIDLSVVLQGGNGRQYNDAECGAVAPGAFDTPTLTNGGNTDVQFCWDYSPDAIDGATVFIEPLFSFDTEDRVFWAVQ